MIAPTKFYEHVPTIDPDEAAGLVGRSADRAAGARGHAARPVRPGAASARAGHGRIVLNTAFRMFPESAAASGEKDGEIAPNADQIAFTQLLRGLYL